MFELRIRWTGYAKNALNAAIRIPVDTDAVLADSRRHATVGHGQPMIGRALQPVGATVLWMSVPGTQILATLIAVYGIFMPPLDWGWAAFVWAHAVAWFLVTDLLRPMAYRVFDPAAVALLVR